MSRRSKILKENPEVSENEDLMTLIEEADKLHDIKVLATSPGGKLITKALLQDVVNKIAQLESMYKTASHTELIAVIADMSANLSLAKVFIKSEENVRLLDEQIAEALTE